MTSAAGSQVERSIEQPFGAPYDGIYCDGPRFTGHATDAASGLSYMQQRYYDPIAMRFLSVNISDARNQTLYRYCRRDTVKRGALSNSTEFDLEACGIQYIERGDVKRA